MVIDKARHMMGFLVALVLLLTSVWGDAGFAQEGHGGGFDGEGRPELVRESPIALDVSTASDIGAVYVAYPSPQQEGGEEEDTPRFTPDVFRSTEPSVPREERPGRAHVVLEFTNDLSRAYIHVQLANIDPEKIVLFHLHCGRPGQLGPIIVDFGTIGDYQQYLADGLMTVEITNADLEAVIDNGEGLVGAFTAGCPITAATPTEKVTTIGGMEYIARQGDLYFNLHTASQTFFGDIRGAFYPVEVEN